MIGKNDGITVDMTGSNCESGGDKFMVPLQVLFSDLKYTRSKLSEFKVLRQRSAPRGFEKISHLLL